MQSPLLLTLLVLIGVSMAEDPPTASISSHVLDISRGVPAEGVQVISYIEDKNGWTKIGDQFTQSSGRVPWISPGKALVSGTYRIVFMVNDYYKALGIETFYPFIEVYFKVTDPTVHYHVPLTLSPFGYSTTETEEEDTPPPPNSLSIRLLTLLLIFSHLLCYLL